MNNKRKSTGNRSVGGFSTGHFSTGNWSTGNHSTGNWSTGNHSTGNWSTGGRSTGDRSTGNWSISNYSTGHFSTVDYSGFGAFDKPCSVDVWASAKKPKFIFFRLTKWIESDHMTREEKEKNPNYAVTGGYLKRLSYKEAWLNAWNSAAEEDKELLYKLPNFDAEVFKKISGIDVKQSNADAELKRKKAELIEKANELLAQAEEL